jgi:hypothetical protein
VLIALLPGRVFFLIYIILLIIIVLLFVHVRAQFLASLFGEKTNSRGLFAPPSIQEASRHVNKQSQSLLPTDIPEL